MVGAGEVQMIPYTKHAVESEDVVAVVNALTGSSLTSGMQVTSFEYEFADAVGAKYALACNSGTSALYIAYMALDILKHPIREIMVPDVTFTATAAAGALAIKNAGVVLTDVTEDGAMVPWPVVVDTIITPVYLNGDPGRVSLADLHSLGGGKNLVSVIADAAHALGADGVGSEPGADATCFSLHPAKHVACGEGGMVTTDNQELHEIMMMVRSHGVRRTSPHAYDVEFLSFNFRMPEMSAALGRSQLRRLKDNVARRREIAARYSEAFDAAGVKYVRQTSRSSYHLFPIKVQERDKVIKELADADVGTQINYERLSSKTAYKFAFNSGRSFRSSYPDVCLSIPMFHSLRDSEVDYVIEHVKRCTEGRCDI
jgi:dTDP-4-amino-4,6-dideoxygalactose transaminase